MDESEQPAFTAELTNGCFVSTTDFIQTWKKELFVRDCYPKLYEESLRQFKHRKQAVFIVGTPGIGKSCFLDYLLVKYVSQKQKVLYLSGTQDKAYLFSEHGPVREAGLKAGLNDLKPDEFDVVLFDPHETATETNVVHRNHLRGKPVFVTMSPDPENCKRLRKDLKDDLAIDLYMGTQPLKEAQKMREACYPELSAETVNKRHKRFGGVARFLYESEKGKLNVCPAAVALNQEAALNDLVTNPLRIDALTVPAEFKSLWSLYHLQPLPLDNGETKWDECTVEICCDDAHTRIRDTLLKREVGELWNIFCSTRNTEGTLRGIRYEAYAHKKIMQSGLSGTAQSLIKAGIGKRTIEVEIPPGLEQVSVPTNDVGEHLSKLIEDHEVGYLLPELSNFPVVDSMAIGGKVGNKKAVANLQMKAGRSDGLSNEAGNVMTTTKQDILIFIVPDKTVMRKALKGYPKMKQYRMIVNEKTKASTKKRKWEAAANKKSGKAKIQ